MLYLWVLPRLPSENLSMPRRLLLLIVACLVAVGARIAAAEEIALVVDHQPPVAVRRAIDELKKTFEQRRDSTREVATTSADPNLAQIVIGTSDRSPEVVRSLEFIAAKLADKPESLVIEKVRDKRQLIVAGRDERGLVYALRDLSRAIELTLRKEDVFSKVVLAHESPLLKVRNVSVHLFNADVEREWFFSEDFWHFYFRQLSLSRFNQFTLTYSDQTNYLCPLYPYLVDMPEYPGVQVEGLTPAERAKNQAMLRRISDLAREYAIDFNLAIWMQAPVPRYSAPVQVTGLPEGLKLADYCALGLKRILAACPSITGIQLRMNDEAGVKPEEQTPFYQPIFQSIAAAGRPIRLDLRYKGLLPATLDVANQLGLDTTVSTKFWSEHFGLPYHPTSVDTHWRESRYSFGAMLRQPRNYKVVYQLWNVGSQRVTLWGDPHYAAQFAKNCLVGDGEGFEIFAPLTNKGYGNRPGAWNVWKEGYRVGRWEQERYWFFYLCFGRMGYNPQTSAEVWQREFRSRFGEAAENVEQAYIAASKVLPLITAARLPGASEWSWWPEMDTGGSLREYMHIVPSDPRQFYGIRTWQRTPGWRWEDWDETPGYVEDIVKGKLSGKTTPLFISNMLRDYAYEIHQGMKHAGESLTDPTAEWHATTVDMKILAGLARYHAFKLDAATQLALSEVADQPGRLNTAREHVLAAIDAWKEVVTAADVGYHNDLVFGVATNSPRSKLGHHHTGHWRDRLIEVEADRKLIDQLIDERGAKDMKFNLFALEKTDPHIGKDWSLGHQPPAELPSQGDYKLAVTITGNKYRGRNDPQQVILHYRPLDQTRDWQQLPMTSLTFDRWYVTIPASQIDPHFDLQYYVEMRTEQKTVIAPEWEFGEVPYFIVKRKR